MANTPRVSDILDGSNGRLYMQAHDALQVSDKHETEQQKSWNKIINKCIQNHIGPIGLY